MPILKFKITDLTCEACVKLSTVALKKIPSVSNVKITKSGETELVSDQSIDWNQISSALQSIGKKATQI